MAQAKRRKQGDPKARILAAALAEFAERGFAGARVEAIARRAQANKALLYYHVGDKRALYEAVITGAQGRALGALAASPAGSSPVDRFRTVVANLSEALGSPELDRLILREIASGGANLPDGALEGIGRIFAAVRHAVEEGRSEKQFRAVDPALVHFLMVGGLMFMTAGRPVRERLSRRGLLPVTGERTPGELAESIADLLIHGLMKPQGGAAPKRRNP